jgi:hypothetical protein
MVLRTAQTKLETKKPDRIPVRLFQLSGFSAGAQHDFISWEIYFCCKQQSSAWTLEKPQKD